MEEKESDAGILAAQITRKPVRGSSLPGDTDKRAHTMQQAHAAPAEQGGSISYVYDDSAKAAQIRVWSFARPHYMAFHLSWMSFHLAFIAWFSIAPLMPVIRDSLNLSTREVHIANLASVSTTILARLVMGSLTDYLGPKRAMASVLLAGAVPVFLSGYIDSFAGLVAVRASVGLIGSAFVMSQSWTSLMFQQKVVGTANAIVAGWGNLGGGVTQVLMVSMFSGLVHLGYSERNAWRHSFALPACLLVLAAAGVLALGTDSPKGDFRDLRRAGHIRSKPLASIALATRRFSTWVLALQYALSFGTEVTLFNMAASYFVDRFHMSAMHAGLLATLSGITNIVSRASGGFASDKACEHMGMKGRVLLHFFLAFAPGVLLLWFAAAETERSATAALVLLSFLAQAANGSCFALVPYVSEHVGSVSGIVGAGGNVGGVCFALMFLFTGYETSAGLKVMGWVVLVCSSSIFLICGCVDDGREGQWSFDVDTTVVGCGGTRLLKPLPSYRRLVSFFGLQRQDTARTETLGAGAGRVIDVEAGCARN